MIIRIGYLVPFVVLQNRPDYDSYLVMIPDNGALALLPKKYAIKKYSVGNTAWAAVFTISGARIILSQNSPQYIRKVLEYIFSKDLQEKKLKFKKVAILQDIAKVAVETEHFSTGKEIYEYCRKFLDNNKFFNKKLQFVKYDTDKKLYAVNALEPAPVERVQKVIYMHDIEEADVYVESGFTGLFYGRKGKNLLAAIKLTNVQINIYPV